MIIHWAYVKDPCNQALILGFYHSDSTSPRAVVASQFWIKKDKPKIKFGSFDYVDGIDNFSEQIVEILVKITADPNVGTFSGVFFCGDVNLVVGGNNISPIFLNRTIHNYFDSHFNEINVSMLLQSGNPDVVTFARAELKIETDDPVLPRVMIIPKGPVMVKITPSPRLTINVDLSASEDLESLSLNYSPSALTMFAEPSPSGMNLYSPTSADQNAVILEAIIPVVLGACVSTSQKELSSESFAMSEGEPNPGNVNAISHTVRQGFFSKSLVSHLNPVCIPVSIKDKENIIPAFSDQLKNKSEADDELKINTFNCLEYTCRLL